VSIETQRKEDELKQVRSARDQEKDLNPTPQPSGMDKAVAKLRDLSADIRTSRRLVLAVENNFRAISRYLFQRLARCPPQHQPGWAVALLTLVRKRVAELGESDIEDFLRDSLEVLRVSLQPSGVPAQDTLLRTRVSYILRAGFSSFASEQQQLHLSRTMLAFLNDAQRGDSELQVLLTELSHTFASLGDASAVVAEALRTRLSTFLRHSSYAVRADAATALVSLAKVNTGIAVDILQEALKAITTQTQALLGFASDTSAADQSSNKKQRDAERLQRMFYFHGCGMVIAFMLQNASYFLDVLPETAVPSCVDFGFYLVQRFLLAKVDDNKSVICTLTRTGWSILSSFTACGYRYVKTILPKLMSTWTENIFTICAGSVPGYELTQELVSLDSALTSVESLIRFCPEALYQHSEALRVVGELLEASSLVIKERFQPKLLNTLRFRVLKGTLMNAFAWLPPGSFPNSCSAMFVDALRMLCDTTSAGVESAALNMLVSSNDKILDVEGDLRPPGTTSEDGTETYDNEMLHLESLAQPLHRKENEAAVFLTVYGLNFDRFLCPSPLHGNEWKQPLPPSASVDIRILDAAISLLGATFGHQSNDVQLKAIKAIDSLVPGAVKRISSISMSMLTTDEEKRRRDRRNISGKRLCSVSLVPTLAGSREERDCCFASDRAEPSRSRRGKFAQRDAMGARGLYFASQPPCLFR
jgi:hypothetical protein